jgi:NAD(P)-dependent dehydrogenase (short-subunit alcohol dehydrogenase family)
LIVGTETSLVRSSLTGGTRRKASLYRRNGLPPSEGRRLFDACIEKFRRLDILVNNAGVMFTKPVAERWARRSSTASSP